LAIDVIALAALLAAGLFGVVRLSSAPLSMLTVLWILLPLLAAPLGLALAYDAYGLLTASYRVDREGLRVRWGWSVEQVPIASIQSVRTLTRQVGLAGLKGGLRWPATRVGTARQAEHEGLEIFLAQGRGQLLQVEAADRSLLLSPVDAEAFLEAYNQARLLGSLQPMQSVSLRPRFALAELVADRIGRLLLLGGIALPLVLLGYLAFRVPDLPAQVPFGFDPQGLAETFAPPGRLLLLPLISGLCWLFNFSLGLWLYRLPSQRMLSYALWSGSVLVGALFWGAMLQLLTA